MIHNLLSLVTHLFTPHIKSKRLYLSVNECGLLRELYGFSVTIFLSEISNKFSIQPKIAQMVVLVAIET
jgi:hypothetical protein